MNDPSAVPARGHDTAPLSDPPPPADPAPAEVATGWSGDSHRQPPPSAGRRELELELARIRNEASAARLQARAAELELMIRRLGRPGGHSVSGEELAAARSPELPEEEPPPPAAAAVEGRPSEAAAAPRFRDWDQVRAALAEPIPAANNHQSHAATTPPAKHAGIAEGSSSTPAGQASGASPNRVPAEEMRRVETSVEEAVTQRRRRRSSPGALPPSATTNRRGKTTPRKRRTARTQSATFTAKPAGRSKPTKAKATAAKASTAALVRPASGEGERPRRQRPAAWIISAAVHAALVALLAAMTLSARRPKDQVALRAVASEPQPTPMQTFSVETPQPEAAEPPAAAATVAAEVRPVGELAAAELELDAPPAAAAAAEATRMLRGSRSAAAAALNSETAAATQFCGVAGGGNHFVYLVDSSGSMGEAFASARAELLRSIDQLGPEQRFYVIFFDAEPDYMRLSDPNRDEPTSVLATPQHKQSLRRWAMQVSVNPGRAPYEPLRFALDLRPDVIFLLSDGEFPKSIEQLLQQHNRVDNLFGDAGPHSIVHTIGYHSRQGDSRMRAIAAQNGGQYRHVPAP